MVREMEAAYAKHAPPRQVASSSGTAREGDLTDPEIPDEEELDEKASLEREFKDSLAAFDEMLLKKWDEILATSARKMRDLSEEVGESAGPPGQEGEGEEASEAQEGTEETGEGEMPSEEGTEAQETAAESRESESKGDDKDRTLTQKQRRTYDGHDDDIVARQLREAAERETDPELKEKLWKEYEDYKKGTSQ